MAGRVLSPEMLMLRPADTFATVEGHVLHGVTASGARGAGVLEQGTSSRDRREPGRPCWICFRAIASREPNERLAKSNRESEWSEVPRKVGNRASSGPTGGKGPPEEEDR